VSFAISHFYVVPIDVPGQLLEFLYICITVVTTDSGWSMF